MAGGIHPPSSVVAAWPDPNFIDPVTHGDGVFVLCICLGALALIVFGARLWARFVILHNAGVDDWLMIAAMVPAVGMLVGTCLAVETYDFDHHIWDLPLAQIFNQRKITWANEYLYILSSGLIKLSILTFYNRFTIKATLFSPTFTWAVRIIQAFVVAYMITFTFTLYFACNQFSAFWNQLNPAWSSQTTYYCIDEGANLVAASIVSVVQDFIIALLPVLLLRRLQLPQRQKVVVGGILALGLFVCITGLVRIYYIHVCYYSTYDITWYAYPLWGWTAAEIALAIICASAPALRVFFKEYLGEGSSIRNSMPSVTAAMMRRKVSRCSSTTTRTLGEEGTTPYNSDWDVP